MEIVKQKLNELMSMCIEKGLTLNLHSKTNSIDIYKLDNTGVFLFNDSCYYAGNLSTPTGLDNLIESVKRFNA